MKKTVTAFIFIFLTGLFSGLFFSMSLDDENRLYLSSLLLSSFSDTSVGFFRALISSLVSAMSIAALMLASVVTKLLSPLPPALLFYRSFALGFCSGLIYLGNIENALVTSLAKLLPASLFFIPAFILLAAVCFICSRSGIVKAKRPSREKKSLKSIVFICLALIAAGCITEALCHLIAL